MTMPQHPRDGVSIARFDGLLNGAELLKTQAEGMRSWVAKRGFPQLALRASQQWEIDILPRSPKRKLRDTTTASPRILGLTVRDSQLSEMTDHDTCQ